MRLAVYSRAFITVIAGILLTTLVGSFIATPTNPTEFRQKVAKLDSAVKEDMVFRDGEAEAFLAVPDLLDPPFWIAVLDWHGWLLVPGVLLAFLILRPQPIPALLATGIAAVPLYFLVAPVPALYLLIGSGLGLLGVCGLARTRFVLRKGAA